MQELISREVIDKRIQQLGEVIAADYRNKDLHVLSVLKGAFMFTSDLIRALPADIKVCIDFVHASSYVGTVPGGLVVSSLPVSIVQGKDVLVVEDIVDTGATCTKLCRNLRLCGVRSLRFCTLLDKPSRRRVTFKPDYIGFTVPDKFIVGYGLDYCQMYRQLSSICILDDEDAI
jgi:hypoxanthine phosphoribosyltransferase